MVSARLDLLDGPKHRNLRGMAVDCPADFGEVPAHDRKMVSDFVGVRLGMVVNV